MKLKLDENVSVRTVPLLEVLGHDVDTVLDEGLGGRNDADVWLAAQREARFLVTQDLDFSDIRKFAPGSHSGIMLIRVPDNEQSQLPKLIATWFSDADCESWAGCFVVATPNKIRITRPASAN